MKKYIPNFFTFLNMVSGLIAVVMVFRYQLETAALFVFMGILFDFMDGFFARILHVKSELGLQLDSLADMVTSGVVPGAVMFIMLQKSLMEQSFEGIRYIYYVPYLGFVLSLAAGYRLAKFNLDTRQRDSFIGLPTPAMSIFMMSLPLIMLLNNNAVVQQLLDNPYFLIFIILIFSYLMNSNLNLFALKFKNFSWEDNALKYVFLLISFLLVFILKVTAIPLIILLYILISLINAHFEKSKN